MFGEDKNIALEAGDNVPLEWGRKRVNEVSKRGKHCTEML